MGYEFWAERFKTPFAEIDLIFQTPEKVFVMVEVKSIGKKGYERYRVSSKQRMRLKRAHQYFCSRFKKVEFHLALVDLDLDRSHLDSPLNKRPEVTLLKDFLSFT